MARIIYKKGHEGQNTIGSIEGIEIELLNGQKALIYPKYKELPLFFVWADIIKSWKAADFAEMKALKVVNAKELTDELYELGSPAAKFVRQFSSEKSGEFDLPTLLAAGEISEQMDEIDALALTIEGADLLSDFNGFIWSCCRYCLKRAWFVYNSGIFGNGYNLSSKLLTIPVSLYR